MAPNLVPRGHNFCPRNRLLSWPALPRCSESAFLASNQVHVKPTWQHTENKSTDSTTMGIARAILCAAGEKGRERGRASSDVLTFTFDVQKEERRGCLGRKIERTADGERNPNRRSEWGWIGDACGLATVSGIAISIARGGGERNCGKTVEVQGPAGGWNATSRSQAVHVDCVHWPWYFLLCLPTCAY